MTKTYLPTGWVVDTDGVPWYLKAASLHSGHSTRKTGRWRLCDRCGRRFPSLRARFCTLDCWYDSRVACGRADLFDGWTPPDAWLAGLIWADGNLQPPTVDKRGRSTGQRVTIVTTDHQMAQEAAAIVGVDPRIRRHSRSQPGRIRGREIRSKKPTWTVRFGRAEPIDRLTAIGLHPKKSLTLTFPDLPVHALPHFVRGHFDGDGSVSRPRRHDRRLLYTTIVGTKEFLDGVQTVLAEHAGIHRRELYQQGIWRAVYAHGDSQRLAEFMYSAGGPCLERKQAVFFEAL